MFQLWGRKGWNLRFGVQQQYKARDMNPARATYFGWQNEVFKREGALCGQTVWRECCSQGLKVLLRGATVVNGGR